MEIIWFICGIGTGLIIGAIARRISKVYSGYAFSANPWRILSSELLKRAALAIAFTSNESCYPVDGFWDIGWGLSTETPTFAQLVKEYGDEAAADIADLLGIER